MSGLFIASTHPKAGKTLCACSMGVLLQKRGYKVGYMKPVGDELRIMEAGGGDADALVVQEVLGQYAAPQTLTPVMRPGNWTDFSLVSSRGAGGFCPDPLEAESDSDLTEKKGFETCMLDAVKAAYASLAKGKDLVLVNGTRSFPSAGMFAGVDGLTLVRELGLKVLLVESCEEDLNFDSWLFIRQMLGESLLGVILNKLPEKDIPLCIKWLVPYLRAYDVDVLGIIPYDHELNIIRSMNLAYELGGRIVAGNNSAASTGITGFLIGSMQVESFMMHLRSRTACAVVVGGDRTDLQLAALYGKGNCLVLTGNIGPQELVRSRAEQLGVPIIVVKEDTYVVARRISRILKGQKFNDLEQINRGIRLFDKSMDLDPILSAL